MITNPNKPNQDSYLINSNTDEGSHLFAVADGHGAQGHFVSQLAIKRLEEYFGQDRKAAKNYESLFTDIYNKIQN